MTDDKEREQKQQKREIQRQEIERKEREEQLIEKRDYGESYQPTTNELDDDNPPDDE